MPPVHARPAVPVRQRGLRWQAGAQAGVHKLLEHRPAAVDPLHVDQGLELQADLVHHGAHVSATHDRPVDQQPTAALHGQLHAHRPADVHHLAMQERHPVHRQVARRHNKCHGPIVVRGIDDGVTDAPVDAAGVSPVPGHFAGRTVQCIQDPHQVAPVDADRVDAQHP